MKSIIIIFTILIYASPAVSHEPKFSDRTDIHHILESFSERTGTKFVTDPRIKARVNMIGIDLEEISQSNLMDILLIHAFTAYEKDNVVYILPQAVAAQSDLELGTIWGNR